ncbi:MAG: hypothetical protein IAF08_05745 [Rhizobacter sp.]|nr:hypothetical protein [Chlorobiales bacterium]
MLRRTLRQSNTNFDLFNCMENLLDDIGGAPIVDAILDRFTERLAEDASLAVSFSNRNAAELREQQRKFLNTVLVGLSVSGERVKFNSEELDLFTNHITESLFDLQMGDEVIQEVLRRIDEYRNGISESEQAPVRVTLKLPKPEQWVSITIKNAFALRNLNVGMLPAGAHVIEWDKRDNDGNVFPRGLYRLEMFVDSILVKSIEGAIK